MAENSVAERLRALAASPAKRSETARLRDVLPDVEAAIAAGVSRASILETLHEAGFTMKMTSFESALHRLRKKQKGKKEDGRKEECQSTLAGGRPPAPPPTTKKPVEIKKNRTFEFDPLSRPDFAFVGDADKHNPEDAK